MKYSTIGIKIYEGSEVPVKICEAQHYDVNISNRFRLMLISKGSGLIETTEGFSHFVAPTLCCINETETIKIQSTQSHETIELIFHPEFLNPAYDLCSIRHVLKEYLEGDPQEATWLKVFTHRSTNYKGIINISSGILKRIEVLLHQIHQELLVQRDWYWPCRTRSFLLELLLIIDRIYVEPQIDEAITINAHSKIINDMIMYLMNHYQEKIQLTELTGIFNINRTSLNEYFKEATGHTIMNYLIQLRIQLAMSMLKDTSLQISEIMYRVGYINSSHFIRAFKKITGLPPSEYREIHTWLYK